MTCTVSGNIIDIQAQPMPGAALSFQPSQTNINRSGGSAVVPAAAKVVTDANGDFTVVLLPGTYTVAATKGQYASAEITVPDAATALLEQIIDAPAPATVDAAQQAVLDARAERTLAQEARVATGQDAGATAADRVATAEDRVATGEDREATGLARQAAEEAADRVDLGELDAAVLATGQDAEQTALDRVATGEDRTATAADRVQTGLDRTAAEAARDAAFVNADVYDDTAAGLAAVADGDQFQVVSGPKAQRYRRDAGPVATPVATYFSVPDGAEILWSADLDVPFGWYDTGERLVVGTSQRLVLSNAPFGIYSAGGIKPDLIFDPAAERYAAGGAFGDLSSAMTFTRTGVAQSIDASDAYAQVAEDAIRAKYYTWNGYELANAGMAFETDAALNANPDSDDFSNWALTFCTGSGDTLTSSSGGFARKTLTLDDSSDYVFAFDGQPGSLGWAYIFIRNKAGSDVFGFVNLSTGAIGTTTGGTWASERTADGWWRFFIDFVSASGGTAPFVQVQFATDNGSSGAPSGATIKARRLNVTKARALPIQTDGSAATRGAEAAELSATWSADGVWGAIRGAETYADAGAAEQELLFDWRVDANNRITLALDTASAKTGDLTLTVVDGGVSQSVSAAAMEPGWLQPFEVAWRVDGSEINVAVNGVAATAVSTANMPDLSAVSPTLGGNGTRALIRAGTGAITDDTLEIFSGKPEEIHAFLLIGQSNMAGRATYDSLGVHPAFVQEWTQAGVIADASVPLSHVSQPGGSMGPDITFAARYRLAYPNAKLLFIPCAKGSTGFANGDWSEGDASYEAAVSRTIAALAAASGAQMKGVLWVQGESDATASVSQSAYADYLDAMISALRSDVAALSGVPFVAGQISPALSTGTFVTRDEVNAAIADLPNRVTKTAYASSSGLTTLPDGVHYSAGNLRTLGQRLFESWQSIA